MPLDVPLPVKGRGGVCSPARQCGLCGEGAGSILRSAGGAVGLGMSLSCPGFVKYPQAG